MNDELVILVINHAAAEADNLKSLIEFLDAPSVHTAAPGDWREALGDRRLEAVFVGPDVSSAEIDQLLGELGRFDPNVSIVMTSAGETA